MTVPLPPDASLSDAQLLQASRKRPEAFAVFYRRHASSVYADLRRSVDRQEVALELTAETFAQALRSAHRYREGKGSAGAWLAGIANNLVATYRRRRRVEDRARRAYGIREQTTFSDPHDETVRRLDAEARRGALASAIALLPADQRDAVELRVLEEAPYGLIATRLGCSEAAARVRVHRGLARLRTQIGGSEWT
jgi:RNA polymerase sigma factor (sigma-70 family)